MVWDPAILVSKDLDLIFVSDVSLNISRIDSLASSSSSLAIARPEDLSTTLQPLIQDSQAASPLALTSARIFSQDASSNWLISEGQALTSSRASQINGAGTYRPLISSPEQSSRGSEIEAIVSLGNTVEIRTKQGFAYRLSEQGTGRLDLSSDSENVSITIKRLGRNLSGFAIYAVDTITGAVTLNGQTFSVVQPGYAQAALAEATAKGLVFEGDDLPAYGEEVTLNNLRLEAGSSYGVLFFDASKSIFYSSYSAANRGFAVQVQSFLPENGNQSIFGLEDIPLGSPSCDKDFNDLIVIIETNPDPQPEFEQLTVFGDSLSDFGSRSAALYKQVLDRDAQPPWSGSTFSNAQFNWQTELRTDLGIPFDSTSGAGISNSFIGGGPSPIPATPDNPSYAIGGALSGTQTLYEVLAGLNPPQFPPVLLGPPYDLIGLGVQSQIQQALTADDKQLSRDLVMLWGGGNNLLAAVSAGEGLPETLATVFVDTKASLITLLRSGAARSVVVSTLAPLEGEVDGVGYSMPYLDQLPPDYQALIEAGAATQFREAISAMLKEVEAMFPYAALVDFNNEYAFNWSRFGDELGNFADYGITNTTQSSQAALSTDPDSYLFFDDIHPTQSGHSMLARSIQLTLEAEQLRLDAAQLSDRIVAEGNVANGTRFNDQITASRGGSELNGFAGNDLLTGLNADDVLNGGLGNDQLIGAGGANAYSGGGGADVFFITTESLQGGLQTITDFNPLEGDRLQLSAAYASAVGNLFFLPNQQDWQQAISFQANDEGGLLSVRFTDPATLDGVIALKGLSSFDTAWLC